MKLSPSKSKYRGVVGMQSGKWGVLVSMNGQRIWLGCFWTEVAAAEAYDIAAQCLHGCYAKTNFKPLTKCGSASEAELCFLRSHTAAEIVSMICSRTYHAEFVRCMHNNLIQQKRNGAPIRRELLFQKVLSRADVGQQNRLVIPKQQALKHFCSAATYSSSHGGGVMIETGKIWRFHNTFWRGNRVHVLNGRWTEFVLAKGLKHGDVISVWRQTDELGAEHLRIESRRCGAVPQVLVPCDQSQSQSESQFQSQLHNRTVRLFGVNIISP